MAGFAENMQALFGFDPTRGQMLTGPAPVGRAPQTQAGVDQAQAAADVSGRPYSPEAADPSTPSPTGRVLARLRVPGRQAAARPAAVSPGDGSIGSGFGSDLAAGIGASKVGEDRATSFMRGFAATAKNVDDRRAAAEKAQAEAKKANIDYLKAVFDMRGKMDDRALKAQEQSGTAARQDRQDAETKRWHDIMAPSYAKDASGKDGKELGPKDSILAEQRLHEMSGYTPSDPNWEFLQPAERERRKKVFQRLYENHFGRPYEFDSEGLPAVRRKRGPSPDAAAPTPGAPAPSPDDGEGDDEPPVKKPAPPAALPAPAPKTAAPPPVSAEPAAPEAAAPTPQPPAATPAAPVAQPAAPQTWRKYRSTDGSIKLYNPTTGESKPIDADPNPPTEEQMMQGGN